MLQELNVGKRYNPPPPPPPPQEVISLSNTALCKHALAAPKNTEAIKKKSTRAFISSFFMFIWYFLSNSMPVYKWHKMKRNLKGELH